jgi:hypothetical protein
VSAPVGERYRHPELGFELTVPDGWRVLTDVPPVVLGPGAERRAFAPNVVITAESGGGEPAEQWLERALQQELELLEGAQLVDRWPPDGPHGAVRTLVHHVTEGRPVALTQWWLTAGQRRWVVSASCAPLDYDMLADDVAAIGQSFTLTA